MASNKNQHFVPRCYLRAFSQNDGKTINLYNIDRDKPIFNTPLKNQCSRDYFYGQDDNLERAIQLVERLYASQLPILLKPGAKLNSEAESILKRFWLLQQLRTEAASRRTVEITAEANQLINHPTQSLALEIKEAVQIAMMGYADNLNVLDDLQIVLIENKTLKPFITSDDPAVIVNRWVDMKVGRFLGPSYGINAAGLMCLLPLSPSIYCIMYDSDIYTIPAQNHWTSIKYEKDVDSLNTMQYLNCFANLYFKEKQDSSVFPTLRGNAHQSRPSERHHINYAVKAETINGYSRFVVVDKKDIPEHTEALIHLEALRIKPKNWPSFLKWRPNGYYYSNDSGSGHVRKSHVVNGHGMPYTKRKTGM